jgi:hypothetical protein
MVPVPVHDIVRVLPASTGALNRGPVDVGINMK